MSDASVTAMSWEEAIDRAVGANIDALITLDLRGYGVPGILYEAQRRQAPLPLTLGAARRLAEIVEPGDRVILGTGFVFAPYEKGELDGLVGTVVLARALERALGARPIVAVEPELVDAVTRVATLAGLNVVLGHDASNLLPHSMCVVGFPKDAEEATKAAVNLLKANAPKAVFSIERPGRNVKGVYHMGNGATVSSLAAKYDEVFALAESHGIDRMAIGDVGNELGMGGLEEVVRARIPFGRRCTCPCGGGIAAAIGADHVVVGATSDWGGYGLAAMLAYVAKVDEAAVSGRLLGLLLEEAVRSGLIDGSGYAIPAVDGIELDYNVRLADQLRDVISLPLRTRDRFRSMYEHIAGLQATN